MRRRQALPGFLYENRFVLPVFFLLACYLLYQYSHVFLYYDDFGYFSLSYGYRVPDLSGHHYTFAQMFSYLGHHYTETNGRLLYTGLFLFLYRIGGLPLLQVSMAAIVLGVILSVYACIDKEELNEYARGLAAAILSLLFGTVSVTVARQGIYWFAASFSYVTPAIPFLLLSRKLFKNQGRGPGSRDAADTAGCMLLAFLAGFSQEQWWAAACVLTILAIWFNRVTGPGREDILPGLLIFLSAFAGGLIILFSPAVRMRLGRDAANLEFASLSLPGKILHNLRLILTVFTTGSNEPWLSVFLLAMVLLGLRMLLSGKSGHMLHILHLAATVLVYAKPGLIDRHRFVIWTIYLMIAALEIVFFYLTKANPAHLAVFLAALASVACMLVVPELPTRFLTMWLFLSMVLIGDIVSSWLTAGDFVPVILFTVVLLGAAIPNMETIASGYRANYPILRENETLLLEAAGSESQEPETVLLERQAQYDCGGDMMYVDAYSFMEYWVREYYDLPERVTIEYAE